MTTSASTPPVARRTVLAGGAAAGAGVLALAATGADAAEAQAGSAGARHFRHGVASGDPLPDRVLIWTRVTPTAAATPGSGKGPKVKVRWQVARDQAFRHVVRQGTFHTGPDRDHTVKVDVTGLKPAHWYYYRFTLTPRPGQPGRHSQIGRTRTAPGEQALPGHVRFGVVSCSNLQAGYFTAYRALAKRDDLHAILHLGDYVYEYGPGQYGYGMDNRDIRKHQPAHEMVSLADYRQRHAQYKRDADLQALHRRYPWIITWDDHEVANDTWAGGAENHQPATEGDFHARRARAHRAYDEWMPVRMDGTARLRDGDRLYRRIRFGQLAEISMLDLRTYRSKQVETALPTPVPAIENGVDNPDRTITGRAQLDWLKKSLSSTRVQWKVVGNPVMIAPISFASLPPSAVDAVNGVLDVLPREGLAFNVDQWDGYTDDRREVYAHIRDHQVSDALFVTGDIHSAWAAELPLDKSTYPLSDTAGVEFVCTSVTSNNLKDQLGTPAHSAPNQAVEAVILANNPHIKYLNFDDHGFSVLDITSARAQMDWYVIGDRADRRTPVTWTRSFQTKAGTGKLTAVTRPVGGA